MGQGIGSILRREIPIPSLGTSGSLNETGQPGQVGSGAGYETRMSTSETFTRGDGPNAQTGDSWLHRVNVPKSHLDLPLVGIGISPDSHIHSCGISLPETLNEGRTISPGNPLLIEHQPASHTFDAFTRVDVRAVSPPDGLVSGWEAVLTPDQSNISVLGFPLRLELYYGVIPPRSQHRAPLHASWLVTTAPNKTATFVVCVDGRRRIEIEMLGKTAGTLNTFSLRALRTEASGTAEEDTVVGSLALGTTNQYFRPWAGSFLGVPSLIALDVACAVGGTAGVFNFRVHATDDFEPYVPI